MQRGPLVVLFIAAVVSFSTPVHAHPADPPGPHRPWCKGPEPVWSHPDPCPRHHKFVLKRREARQAARAAAAVPAEPPAPPSPVSTVAGACGGITPYEGGGQCWAIPYAIVLCESGGSYTAYNPSGASGAYQLMVGGGGSPAEQDAAAAALWNGGAGASNWVCTG